MEIIVIGGGLAGLSAALMLARRGHDVHLLERDRQAPPLDPDEAFENWERRGVGHIRQTHQFLCRSTKVMLEEAPDIIEGLMAAGAVKRSMGYFSSAPLEYPIIHARRTTYEVVLRRAVAAEAGIRMHSGVTVAGLIATEESRAAPVIVGVRTDAGEEIRGELVVDAAGRRSRVGAWLREFGGRCPVETGYDVGFQYVTRWYRLREGEAMPLSAGLPAAVMSYGMVFVLPADRAHFSVTFIACREDPLRKQLFEAGAFERVVAAVPLTAAWTRRADAVTRPQAFGNVDDFWRRLVDDSGPIVGGYVLVGDSLMHTNPTQARGAALALVQAQRVAATVEQSARDPVAYVGEYEAWVDDVMRPWFEMQVEFDRANSARWNAFFTGEILQPPTAPSSFFLLQAAARADPEIAALFDRVFGVLVTPDELLADPNIRKRVHEAAMAAGAPLPPDILPRARFEELAGN